MDLIPEEELIARFSREITKVTWGIVNKFYGGKFVDERGDTRSAYGSVEWNEVNQEVVSCLLSYAGFPIDKPVRVGFLHALRRLYPDDPDKVANFIQYDLELDVKQRLNREYKNTFESEHKPESIFSADEDNESVSLLRGDCESSPLINAETPEPIEHEAIATTKGSRKSKWRAAYPTLWLTEVEGYSQQDAAKKLGVDQSTICRRLTAEKEKAKNDPGNSPEGLDCQEDNSTDAPFTLGELQRCDLLRNGLGPDKGHCKWCNRAIEDGQVTEEALFAQMFTNPVTGGLDIDGRNPPPIGGRPCWKDSPEFHKWVDDNPQLHIVERAPGTKARGGFPGWLSVNLYVDMAMNDDRSYVEYWEGLNYET